MDILELDIKGQEGFNEQTNEFITIEPMTLRLKHTLVSLKKWEQKYHVPFLDDKREKTAEQWIYYMKCMTLNENVNPDVYSYMSGENIKKITDYIKDPMTATWVTDNSPQSKSKINQEVVTAEVIYYWMIETGIPIEFENWHLNQLMTLIRVINAKRNPKTMSKKDEAMQRSALNAQRKAKYRTKG